VKPDNILMTKDGTAKLADLGLVKETEADLNLTRTGRGLGTPHFMAPEQFRNAKHADPRCDIYSMGATLYMLVTGELPFKSCGPLDAWMKKVQNEIAPAKQRVPTLSDRVDWAIRRAMSADPEERPDTCREFVEDLTGHSTRKLPNLGNMLAKEDFWYLVYKDDEGTTHTVKGSVVASRRSLKEGLLGAASNVRACRVKTGPFELLKTYPEFRDLVLTPGTQQITPVPTSAATPPSLPAANIPVAALVRPSAVRAVEVPALQEQVVHAPLINLGTTGDQSEWVKWLLLFLLAVAAGVAGYFFLPQ